MKAKAFTSAMAALLIFSGAQAASAAAQIPLCPPPSSEHIEYDWQLAGALSWVASIAFPTSGTAQLDTSWNRTRDQVKSTLNIRDRKRSGYFIYRSNIDAGRSRTLMSEHGYSWDGRTKIEEARFDYGRKVAHMSERDTRDGSSSKVQPVPEGDLQDVLTAIWVLRQRAAEISSPMRAEIYSDGKMYPVLFVPQGQQTITVGKKSRTALAFRITAVPEEQRKWPGGVSVWLSDDSARTPLRIDIKRSLATLRLTMSGGPGCSS